MKSIFLCYMGFLICIFDCMKVLIISTVWVEPTSSAAGSRMLQLLELFLEQDWTLTYASTAGESEYAFDLESLGVRVTSIEVNNPSFNAFAKAYQPDIVLFDRFIAEEQFGWRISEQCPTALKILDTEDLHCLRKARALAIKERRSFKEADVVSDVAKREIAAIYRSDLTLIISSVEMELLQRFCKVPKTLLCEIPFLLSDIAVSCTPFDERQHFISIGTFIHAPNWDAVLELKRNIWPLIRKQLPEAELHIYGAYPTDKVFQLHHQKEGFIIKGRVENALEVIQQARLLLAPLRFGAGLKGKFIDAMSSGTPSITTQIGAEGMTKGLHWGGIVIDQEQAATTTFYNEYAQAAVTLYTHQKEWREAQLNGFEILKANFQKSAFAPPLLKRIYYLLRHREQHRLDNFTGQMLMHHTLRSTKYMSKWIEAKNKKGLGE